MKVAQAVWASFVLLSGVSGFTSTLAPLHRIAPSTSSDPASLLQQKHLPRTSARTTPSRRPLPVSALAFHPSDWQHVGLDALQSYTTLLKTHPLTTKAVTASLLALVGDAIAQQQPQSKSSSPHTASDEPRSSEEKDTSLLSEYDWRRGLVFALFGAAYTGAFQHFWFDYLSNHVAEWGAQLHLWSMPHSLRVGDVVHWPDWWSYWDVMDHHHYHPPTPAMLAAAKVAINQFVMIPMVYMPVFFFMTSGFDPRTALQRAQTLYIPLLQRNYVYWLPMQFCQFFVLPSEWQIPFVSAASLVWTIVLSSIGTSSTVNSSPQQQLQQQQQQQQPLLEPAEDAAVVWSSSTEEVSLQDVRNNFAWAKDPIWMDSPMTWGGILLGLLLGAADDASLAEEVSNLLNMDVSVGVILLSLLGGTTTTAVMGTASKKQSEDDRIKSPSS